MRTKMDLYEGLNLNSTINYIIIFTLLYFSSSFYTLSIGGSFTIVGILIIAILSMTINLKSLKGSYKVILFFITIIILSILSLIINKDGIYHYLIFWASFVSALFIYFSIKQNEFIEKYCSIMYYLALFSLLTFILTLLFPNLISRFPSVTNNAGLTVNNLFLSVNHRQTAFVSNYGMFWEPGAYQTFLNIAIFYQLFYFNKINLKEMVVLIFAIITTFSTTAFIATGFIILSYILFVKDLTDEQKILKRRIVGIIFVIIVIGAFVYTQLPYSIRFKVFGKLEAIINPSLLDTYSYSSTAARVSSIYIPIKGMIASPFFGIGFSKLYDSAAILGHGFLTATPINWYGLFGLPSGILMNYSLWSWTRLSTRKIFLRLLIFAFLIMIVMTENYIRNPFYLLFILYGLDIPKNKRLKDDEGTVDG